MLSLTVRATGYTLSSLCLLTLSVQLGYAEETTPNSEFSPIQTVGFEAPPEYPVAECGVPATCCQPEIYCATAPCPCASGCGSCQHGFGGHLSSWWRAHHPHAPCNLYPHYAYFPEHHGHYYFRPYNYETVFEQQRVAARMGLNPANPYAVSILNPLMAEFSERYPQKQDSYEQVRQQRIPLPQLEELLQK